MIPSAPALYPRRVAVTLLLVILLVAAALRLYRLDWDAYQHYQPDERFIAWIATSIEWPADLATAFQPRASSINPYYWPADAVSPGVVVLQDQPRRFAYGHVPLYAGVLATRLADRLAPILGPTLPQSWQIPRDLLNDNDLNEYDHIVAVGRLLTALVDVGTIVLTFGLGRRLFDERTGLLAAAFLAVNVMHIQLAHFFAVDPYLTFFTLATLLALTLALPRPERAETYRPGFVFLAGIFAGLAVGSKFAAILLVLPLALTVFLGRRNGSARVPSRRIFAEIGLVLLVAGVAFFVTNPFAVLDWTCQVVVPGRTLGPVTLPPFTLGSCYLENIVRQSSMVSGAADLGFARQYAGTTPYLYFVEMQLKWGMGLPLGLLAFAGFLWAGLRGLPAGLRRLPGRDRNVAGRLPASLRDLKPPAGELVLLAWALPYFLSTGSFFVKFMRYMQPLTPLLMLYGAALLWRAPWPRLRRLLAAGVLLLTGLYALSFVNMYASTHPWLAASRWVYANVPAGARIVSEQWDDLLPSNIEQDGVVLNRERYGIDELTWLTGPDSADDVDKLYDNLRLVASSNFIALASNRVYGVVPRLADRYPLSSQYYPLLFDGSLGFEAVYVTGRSPTLANFALKSDPFAWPGLTPPAAAAEFLAAGSGLFVGRADESYTVYDHPLVMIFENRAQLTPYELLLLFELPAGTNVTRFAPQTEDEPPLENRPAP